MQLQRGDHGHLLAVAVAVAAAIAVAAAVAVAVAVAVGIAVANVTTNTATVALPPVGGPAAIGAWVDGPRPLLLRRPFRKQSQRQL